MRSVSEYFDVKTELSFHSYNNNGDDKTFGMVVLTSATNYPDVTNVNSNPGLKAQSKRKRVIDRVGFVNGNKDTESFWGSRVWEEHSLGHFDINVCSSGNKRIQKGSVKMIKDKKTDQVTVGIPDMDMETVLGAPTPDSHSPGSYIQSAKPMVAIGKHHNLEFTQGSDGLVHATL